MVSTNKQPPNTNTPQLCVTSTPISSIGHKSDTSSPALTVESFIATLAIDAAKERDVSVCDVAGAFLKAEQPDFVLLHVTGPAIDAVVKANEEKYKKFVTYEGKTRVLYLQLLKAMYGTLTAALLWYQMFAEFLMIQGFS